MLLVAALVVSIGLEQWLNPAVAPRWAAVPTELVVALALAWRRSYPLAVTVIAASGLAFMSVAGVPIQEPLIPLTTVIIAVYSLVVYAPSGRVFAGLVAVSIGLAVAVVSQNKGLGNYAFGAFFVAASVFIGRLVRVRKDDALEYERRAQQLEWERGEQVRLAAEEERRRIARELHDVITHSISVMVVQAGAAEEMLRSDPEQALGPVRSIQETGRDALAEMGRLLGVLREGGDEIGLAPQPSLSDLEALIEDAQAAGVAVMLNIEGEPRSIPPGVELSAYRIVQEALTNTRRHARQARVEVTVRYAAEALEVVVVDDGNGGEEPGDASMSGYGLVGMGERVAVVGGSLDVGPLPGGGFGVHARLPLVGAA